MFSLAKLTEKILEGEEITRAEADKLLEADLEKLLRGADKIRQKYCGDKVSLCSIINGKSGRCSENCKFCAQSACHKTGIEEYGFLDKDKIVEDCQYHSKAGVHRYSIVTAGRTLSDDECDMAAEAYSAMHKACPDIKLCGSHGLLSYEQLVRLRESGIDRYHCNLETGRNYFKNICTTHSFDDKIGTIKAAMRAGLEVCSGGIIGMGESMADRLDMAFELRELGVRSIPINVLTPIPNTPLADNKELSEDEVLRVIAIFRYINPKAEVRLAAGRVKLTGTGTRALKGGANASITGDLLTTSGSTIAGDMNMIKNLGLQV